MKQPMISMCAVTVTLALMLTSWNVRAEDKAPRKLGYDDTPMQPNGKWHVHDGNRPQPTIVTPGKKMGQAPSDAVVILGSKKDLEKWEHPDGTPITWKWNNGALQAGKGYIHTKESFKDIQLHVEWASPKKVEGEGQGRGNSGLFLASVFEVQVLDSFNNQTYPDGQATALYGQYPPLVNASLGPGQWQTYDVFFTAPRFDKGKLTRKARVTVIHNGVVTQNATEYLGPTEHKKIPPYQPSNAEGPIRIQDHNNPVQFRNIWLRTLGEQE